MNRQRYLRDFHDVSFREPSTKEEVWCPECQALKPWKHENVPDGVAVLFLRWVSTLLEWWSLRWLSAAAWLKRRSSK